MIHPGLSEDCGLGSESLTALEGSPCADAPGGLANLACMIPFSWCCCDLHFKLLVRLSCVDMFSADDISMFVGVVEDRSVGGSEMAGEMGR